MSATEYYTGTLPPQRPAVSQHLSHLAPPQGPQRTSSQPNMQYSPQQAYRPSDLYAGAPGAPPPPPYETLSSSPGEQAKPSVHFAPAPQPQHRPNSFSGTRPNPQSWAPTPYYPQHQNPLHQHQLAPYTPQPQPYQNNYSVPSNPAASQLQPYAHYRPTDHDMTSGYSSDPERHHHRHKKHRSRSRSRSRSRDHGRPRRTSEVSRSANADGFIGAAGGGLIGDLIFPGLGTVGGALAGWIGGKKYGSERKVREDRRDRAQYQWEERWNKPHTRDDLAYGDYYEKDDYGRRRSYDDRDRKRRH